MTAITLALTDMAFGGDAVGRHEGQVVFVPGGIPGETVRVQLGDRSKQFARGKLLPVIVRKNALCQPLPVYFRPRKWG